jgi:hypothetical protein
MSKDKYESVIRIKFVPSLSSYSALTYDPNSAPGSSSRKMEKGWRECHDRGGDDGGVGNNNKN